MNNARIFRTAASTLLLSAFAFGCNNTPDAPAARVTEPSAATTENVPNRPSTPVENLTLDAAASKVEFIGAKVTASHEGGFRTLSGTVDLSPEEFSASRVSVTVDTTSLYSDDERLTAHLKSDDFFDVAKFPQATFVSTEIVRGGDGTATHTITGDLTIRGVTKRVTFPATITITPERASATAEFSVDRKLFGIVYAGMADDLIRDTFVLKLSLIANRSAAN